MTSVIYSNYLNVEVVRIHYFAYGSCMDEDDLNFTTKARFVANAYLPNFRLMFTHTSFYRGGGVADIVVSFGDHVEGRLFDVDDIIALDRREMLYDRIYLKVFNLKTMEFENVFSYTISNKTYEEVFPSKEYVDIIRNGAKTLSDSYKKKLEKKMRHH